MRQSNLHRTAISLGLPLWLAAAVSNRVSAKDAADARAGTAALPGEARRSPWRTCLEGFSPGGDPRLDVLRIGVACGPVTGLTRSARLVSVVDENGPPAVLRFTAGARDCFRLFAVAGGTVDDLEVEITGPHRARVSLTNQNRRWLVVGEGGPFCAKEGGDFEARFTTHAGRGPLAAAVYRGARMLVKGSPFDSAPTSHSEDPY